MTKQEAVAIDIVLFLAGHSAEHGAKLATAGAIDRAVGVARRFSEPAMQRLSRAGIIASKRGPVGGYRFCDRPDVTIADILQAVDDQHLKNANARPSQTVIAYLDILVSSLTVRQLLEDLSNGG